jgi:ribosomal protein L37AE/L43A|tara:strand:- start:749 stop:1327 length:579 start_codon:yes stop_codon:yes gene_type:complete
MANYSKDMERQNKALKDLMSGKEHVKDYVQVGYEGKQENRGGETRQSELTDVMASVRMPWFCPSCKKAMKKRLDRKFWNLFNHCMDCQIEIETKMRYKGEFEEYAQRKVLENRKAYVKDLKQSIVEFEKTGGKAEFFNSVGVQEVELEKEKWEMGEEQFNKIVEEAYEHINKLEEAINEEEKLLDTTGKNSS